MNFEYKENPDNTFSIYNTEIEDIYFSNVGAYKEAIEIFGRVAKTLGTSSQQGAYSLKMLNKIKEEAIPAKKSK